MSLPSNRSHNGEPIKTSHHGKSVRLRAHSEVMAHKPGSLGVGLDTRSCSASDQDCEELRMAALPLPRARTVTERGLTTCESGV